MGAGLAFWRPASVVRERQRGEGHGEREAGASGGVSAAGAAGAGGSLSTDLPHKSNGELALRCAKLATVDAPRIVEVIVQNFLGPLAGVFARGSFIGCRILRRWLRGWTGPFWGWKGLR